jgi:iron complex transport system ATP-binding protein
MNLRSGQINAIEARALGVHMDGRKILHDVDLAFARGRWTSIVGPNGAGKSTLLKALAGLLPREGAVRLCGLADDAGARQRARHLAWLGQGAEGANDLTVYDIVMLGRLPHQSWLRPPAQADREAVRQALDLMQAWDWRERSLGRLSGGERQRVLLARALAVQADILLMDEPLVNLDPPHQADWLRLVRGLVAQGRTVVSVLHEISLALHADDIVVMAQGRVRHQGSCGASEAHRAVEQVFDERVQIRQVGDQWICLPRL